MLTQYLPLFVVVPLAGAFLIPLLGRAWRYLADIVGNLVGAFLVAFSIYGLVTLAQGGQPVVYSLGSWGPRLGIVLVYDSLSALIVLIANLVGLPALLFSTRYLDRYTGRWKYYTLFMLLLAGLNGVALAGDIFNLFVFLEIAAVSSYALVAFGTGEEELEAGFKYMVMGEIAGMMVLVSIALLYARTSTLNMAEMSRALQAAGQTPFVWFVLGTMLVGFATKMALMPFHSWLPDAHLSAPAPVSAVLSGVFVKVLGIYAMSRIVFNVFGLTRATAPTFFNLLVGLGLFSLIVASLLAINQNNYKRLLAYSTISQIGYIILGFGIGSYWAIVGALFHILGHSVTKGLLFLASRSIERETGSREIGAISGLEKTMPVTSWSYIAGALSLAGIPPFAGFFSKLFIIVGAVAAKMYWLAIIAALFSVVTMGYMLKVINNVLFARKDREPTKAREAPFPILAALVILVVLALAFGIGFRPVLDSIIEPAARVLTGGLEYARMVLGG
ncbi:MAG TPA: NADH/ubiquinone/plastoquinone (complex I) [candidate division WOR-3 bacterium]|uniref:NADH/ubiquinone/plastoquinone (Complex I) n=1 Tax=candidate division WOR-3 bacterium TaxID=2052148 RepID=A0A7V0T5J0_UNCW3|nr:NADH/ubiquinone/plastoquinone (complex I) [candidate division WOR-3 bacterium]